MFGVLELQSIVSDAGTHHENLWCELPDFPVGANVFLFEEDADFQRCWNDIQKCVFGCVISASFSRSDEITSVVVDPHFFTGAPGAITCVGRDITEKGGSDINYCLVGALTHIMEPRNFARVPPRFTKFCALLNLASVLATANLGQFSASFRNAGFDDVKLLPGMAQSDLDELALTGDSLSKFQQLLSDSNRWLRGSEQYEVEAIAVQGDGHPDVILHDSSSPPRSKVGAIPNFQTVIISEACSTSVKVRWNGTEGWGKASNFKPICKMPAPKKAQDAQSTSPTLFLCHTKKSKRWNAEDFVKDHLWDFLRREGRKAFYDRVDLPGGSIAQCTEVAKNVKVLLVVLDDQSPTPWMVREITAALQHGVKVQTLMRSDTFRWVEVGKDTWVEKQKADPNISDDIIKGAFSLPTIEFNCHPDYLDTARMRFLGILKKLEA